MRNILISVLGSTPQILTETLWCLKVQKGIDIDEVFVITTSYGKRLIIEGTKDLEPLLGNGGVFEKFCKEFKTYPKFTERNIFVIRDRAGNELDDIRDTVHNECASDFITNVIREFSKMNDVVIHCSVAGGRKTMSVFAGLAMTTCWQKT
jgi:CRISPR-associated protein (TIGR02584 family)